jgi:hypothetical protein
MRFSLSAERSRMLTRFGAARHCESIRPTRANPDGYERKDDHERCSAFHQRNENDEMKERQQDLDVNSAAEKSWKSDWKMKF